MYVDLKFHAVEFGFDAFNLRGNLVHKNKFENWIKFQLNRSPNPYLIRVSYTPEGFDKGVEDF